MPASPRRRTAPALTRRAAVTTLVAGLLGTAACDDHRTSPDAGSGVSGGTGAAGQDAAGQDADAALVDRVRTELTDVLAMVTAAGSASASLRARLRPFRELHRAHLAALSDAHSAASATPAPTPRQNGRSSPAATLQQVLQRERLTKARLADAAVSARSGTLARLLASMSAGVAQRVAATDGATGAGPQGATP